METEYWIYVEGAVKDTAYDQQKAAEKDLNDKKLQNEIDKLKADQR